MIDYTPTTADVRDEWSECYGCERCAGHGMGDERILHSAEFDRWLQEHDRQVAEQALEDAAEAGKRLIANKQGGFSHWLRARAAKIREGRQ